MIEYQDYISKEVTSKLGLLHDEVVDGWYKGIYIVSHTKRKNYLNLMVSSRNNFAELIGLSAIKDLQDIASIQRAETYITTKLLTKFSMSEYLELLDRASRLIRELRSA